MIAKLYKKYYIELVRWCQGMTGNLQTAEELVQETWLRALNHADLLASLDEKQRRSWLYRTTKNLYVDQVRHRSKEMIVCKPPAGMRWPQEMEETEWSYLLDSLPDREGQVFAMRYLLGYNSRQIGELLSMPPGTVRFKLSSARKHLRKMIGGKGYGREEKTDAEL